MIITGQNYVGRDAKLLDLFDFSIRKGKGINHDPQFCLIIVNEEAVPRVGLIS